jgi:hypothetical protein
MIALAFLFLQAGYGAAADDGQSSNPQGAAQFERFAPRGATLNAKVDYTWWDTRTRNLVLSMGPSTRSRVSRPQRTTGSQILWGHTSSYRLEGSRLAFSFLEADIIESFTAYRRDLEQTADQIEITALPRNEQLAYWINLHNVAVAEQIAIHWPVREPATILIDGQPLDTARFLTVNGVKLSPSDIRTRIVYPNWRSPNVIYGFWRGTIGGPSLQREAYNADNVSRLLIFGASEFINSLRGTQRRGDLLLTSEIYEEAAPYYFANFGDDLRAHLARYAERDVAQILERTDQVAATITVPDIADLAGGMREPSTTPVTINGRPGMRMTPSIARMLQERSTKLRELGRERIGTVRVELSSASAPANGGEVE